MSPNEEKQQRIQKYLDGAMSREEQAGFEDKLKADKDLAQEVSLQKDMQELLADSPENALRKNLERLNVEFEEKPDQPSNKLNRLLWLLPLLLLAGWWYFANPVAQNKSDEETTETVTQTAPEETKSSQDDEVPIPESLPETEPESREPKQTKQENLQKNRQKPSSENPKSSRPIAANYDPNPSLDFLINNNLRDNTYELSISRKQENVTLLRQDEEFQFWLAIIIKSGQNLIAKDIKLHLFSNKKADFEDFRPLTTDDLALESSSEGTYLINFQKTMHLAPGLYYYLIEDLGEEQIYLVEKFEVRLKNN